MEVGEGGQEGGFVKDAADVDEMNAERRREEGTVLLCVCVCVCVCVCE